MTTMNKLNKILTSGLVGLVAACSPEKPAIDNPFSRDHIYHSNQVRFGEDLNILFIDINHDKVVDIESLVNMPGFVTYVAKEMADSARQKGYNVDASTPRMSPEMREAATQVFNGTLNYNFAKEHKNQ